MHQFDSGRGLKKMKKTALIITLILAFLVFPGTSFAQNLTSERAYEDYQYNLTIYKNANSDFVNARNAYLANKTLSLKEAARQKLVVMLSARDQLMAVYLTTIRTKISELSGLSPEDKNNIFGKIDPEVNFYTNHKAGYSNTDTLETLQNKNAESQTQYENTTTLLVHEALFDISLGQLAGLRIAHEEVFTTLTSLIDAGVATGKLTRDPFVRWLTDIETTERTLKENEATAKTQIVKIYEETYSFEGGYDRAIETLENSLGPIAQLNRFLTEVLNYIKARQ